jgi:hypothetical protein
MTDAVTIPPVIHLEIIVISFVAPVALCLYGDMDSGSPPGSSPGFIRNDELIRVP